MSATAPSTSGSTSNAAAYVIDPTHSEVTFSVRHLVTKVSGKFTKFEGEATLDPAVPANSSVEVRIQVASIDTGNADRDTHLRTGDFFSADEFPEIVFKSSSVTAKGENEYDVAGTFSMHGVTKELVVPVEFAGFAVDPWGNEKAGFETTLKLNRKDYGVSWNTALEAGGFVVGDEVKVNISLQLAKKK